MAVVWQAEHQAVWQHNTPALYGLQLAQVCEIWLSNGQDRQSAGPGAWFGSCHYLLSLDFFYIFLNFLE